MRVSERTLERRRRDRQAQFEYYEEHPYCEICLFEGRGKKEAVHVHEIIFRSQGGKCIPKNEISTCFNDHQRAHFLREPWLSREELFEIKKKGGLK